MKHLLSLTIILLSFNTLANKRASEIYADLLKLNSLNRVLYIAAHPDDENTRLLAYFSLGANAETAYLSLTRGDGGQNLIGNELGYKLGVLRTQELLAARSYDKANQFFTRAVDFGYSKSAEESLDKWGKDDILSDVVLIIRKFKPDIIITRFPPDKRGGHGHHTASAMLAIDAFEKAADESYQPEQVKKFGTWETQSLYWNTSYWWMKDIADSAAKYPDRYFSKDIGEYNSVLGMSYNEIGTIARSQHKCQGFGAILERGPRVEYFEYLAGKPIEHNFFEHSPQSWDELVNESFSKKMQKLVNNFDFVDPSNNVPDLIEILKTLEKQEQTEVIKQKIELCKRMILDCLGLYIEVTAEDYSFISGEEVKMNFYAVNRSAYELDLHTLKLNGETVPADNQTLKPHTEIDQEFSTTVNAKVSTPYWLVNAYENMYVPENFDLIGDPENDPTLIATISIKGFYHSFEMDVPVEYKWRDPSFGERRRDVVCTPKLSANFDQSIVILKEKSEKTLRVKVHSYTENVNDELQLVGPEGWKISPESIPVEFATAHEEKTLEFTIAPTNKAESGEFVLVNNKKSQLYSMEEITYDHIPTQTILLPTKFKAVKLDAEINEKMTVAYINGVEDGVAEAIKQLGFPVDVYEVSDIPNIELKNYETIVLGIRIYNVHPDLFNHHPALFEWVEKGGNLIMQYNTASRSIREKEFGPKPFKLSRNRVTEEDATVTFLDPEHPILNKPNKITEEDFNGWVQERGLYFAGEWSDDYKPLLSWNDKGEDPVNGGLIVLSHGKGQFIYTGVSFFRELPNGVEGAYRLFANLISYPND